MSTTFTPSGWGYNLEGTPVPCKELEIEKKSARNLRGKSPAKALALVLLLVLVFFALDAVAQQPINIRVKTDWLEQGEDPGNECRRICGEALWCRSQEVTTDGTCVLSGVFMGGGIAFNCPAMFMADDGSTYNRSAASYPKPLYKSWRGGQYGEMYCAYGPNPSQPAVAATATWIVDSASTVPSPTCGTGTPGAVEMVIPGYQAKARWLGANSVQRPKLARQMLMGAIVEALPCP